MWQFLLLVLSTYVSPAFSFGVRFDQEQNGKCQNFYDYVCNSALDGEKDQGSMEKVKEHMYRTIQSYMNETQREILDFPYFEDNLTEEYDFIEKKLVELCGKFPESIQELYWLVLGGTEENCEGKAIAVAEEVFNRQNEFAHAKKKYIAMTEAAGFMNYLSNSLSFERQQTRAQELFERGKTILLERMEKHLIVPEYLEEAKQKLSQFVLYQWKSVNVNEIFSYFEKRLNKCLDIYGLNIDSVRRNCFIWAQENSLFDGNLDPLTIGFLTDGPFYENALTRQDLNTILIYPIYYFGILDDDISFISRLGTMLLHELGHVIYRTAWVRKPVTKCIVDRKEESCQQLGKDNACKNGQFTLVEDFCDWISDALAIEILREDYKQEERFKTVVERYYYNRALLACSNKKHSTVEQTTAHSIIPIRVNAVLGRTSLFSEIHNCPMTKLDKETADRCEIL